MNSSSDRKVYTAPALESLSISETHDISIDFGIGAGVGIGLGS